MNVTKWWRHKKGYLKLMRSFFSYISNVSMLKIKRLCQELFMSEFQYQNSTKWWFYRWLGLNLLKPRTFLVFVPKASPTKFHWIWTTKSKVIHVQISVPKLGKNILDFLFFFFYVYNLQFLKRKFTVTRYLYI